MQKNIDKIMDSNYPLVSIGIPTFNRSKQLSVALRNILDQDYKNLEIIVSDNNSSDNTQLIVSKFKDERIKYHKNEKNIGMHGNFNKCIDIASGEFFLLLSDDDVPSKNLISSLIKRIQFNNNVKFAYSKVTFIEDGKSSNRISQSGPRTENGYDFIKSNLCGDRAAFPSASIFRLDEVKAFGGYPQIGNATDFGLILLLCLKNDSLVSFVDKPLVNYHLHEANLSFKENHIDGLDSLIEWIKFVLKDHKNLMRLAMKKYQNDLISTYRFHKSQANIELMQKIKLVYNKSFTSVKNKTIFYLLTNALVIKIYNTVIKKKYD